MNLRFGEIVEGGFFHVFNRGVDKRITFGTKKDKEKFKRLLKYCNTEKPIGSIRRILEGDVDTKFDSSKPLVRIHAVAILHNHYHLLLEQVAPDGISRFMQKVGSAYTRSFNEHNQRAGTLFQGSYKYVLCKTDNHIMQMCAYINHNEKIHNLSTPSTETTEAHYLAKNSDFDFVEKGFCLELFGGVEGYQEKAITIVKQVLRQRYSEVEFE